MLALIESPPRETFVRVPVATRAVVSWNTTAPAGEIAVRVRRDDGSTTDVMPYARWSAGERRTFSASSGDVRVEVDVIASGVPFVGVSITSSADLDAIAVTVPDAAPAYDARADAAPVDVPPISQYLTWYPSRALCSAAATTMLLGAHGVAADVTDVVHAVADAANGGTGTWPFNVAHAGTHGLRAVVAYLRGIEHAGAFVRAGLPVAMSIRWHDGDLPGAPLPRSDGHLIVLRGLDGDHALVNDPAHADVATRYSRAALDRVFRAHGGAAYLVAPRERSADLVTLANIAGGERQ